MRKINYNFSNIFVITFLVFLIIFQAKLSLAGSSGTNCSYEAMPIGPWARISYDSPYWMQGGCLAITKSQTFHAVDKWDPDVKMCEGWEHPQIIDDEVLCYWMLFQRNDSLIDSYTLISDANGDTFQFTAGNWPTNKKDNDYQTADRHYLLLLFVRDKHTESPDMDDGDDMDYWDSFYEGTEFWGCCDMARIDVVVPDNEAFAPPDPVVTRGLATGGSVYSVKYEFRQTVSHGSGVKFQGLTLSEIVVPNNVDEMCYFMDKDNIGQGLNNLTVDAINTWGPDRIFLDSPDGNDYYNCTIKWIQTMMLNNVMYQKNDIIFNVGNNGIANSTVTKSKRNN